MCRKLEEIHHYDSKGHNDIFLTLDPPPPQANSLCAQKSGKSQLPWWLRR